MCVITPPVKEIVPLEFKFKEYLPNEEVEAVDQEKGFDIPAPVSLVPRQVGFKPYVSKKVHK